MEYRDKNGNTISKKEASQRIIITLALGAKTFVELEEISNLKSWYLAPLLCQMESNEKIKKVVDK